MGWRMDNEQRQTRRVSVELPLKFRVQGNNPSDTTQFLQAVTTNVSLSGVGFVASINMPLHAHVVMALAMPGLEQDLQAEGLVVRIVADRPEIQGIEYGVRFTTVEPREALERYVRSVDIFPLLKLMAKHGASDLHLSVSTPPYLRVGRDLVPAGEKAFAPDAVEALIGGVMGMHHRRKLRRWRDVSFPYTLPGVGRWHVNVFYQRGFTEATFHAINQDPPTLDELGLPEVLRDVLLDSGGLVLVTGPMRSGKSTTLAALLGFINKETRRSIVSLEDPIQFALLNDRSIIRQREVGNDTRTYAEGIRTALLQDADVIAVGEVADPETTEMVLRASEAGRLVLASVPTADLVQTLERIVALRPVEERAAVLHILSTSLKAVVCQRLLPQLDGRGLVLAAEVVPVNESIRNAIRVDKLDQIMNLVRAVPGYQPLDSGLRSLVLRRLVDADVAASYCSDSDRFRKSLAEHRV